MCLCIVLINFVLRKSCLIDDFTTTLGGWSGGWLGVQKKKNKDHLNPAEAEIGAELRS